MVNTKRALGSLIIISGVWSASDLIYASKMGKRSQEMDLILNFLGKDVLSVISPFLIIDQALLLPFLFEFCLFEYVFSKSPIYLSPLVSAGSELIALFTETC